MDIMYVGAWLAIGLAGLGVGIGEGIVAMKSINAMGKNPELTSKLLIITILGIALVESAAIYGLIIAFQILWADPWLGYKAVGAGIAVGAAWLGVGIGEWYLVGGAIDAILRNPSMQGKIMTYMILFLALVESAAIYGLIIAFQLLA